MRYEKPRIDRKGLIARMIVKSSPCDLPDHASAPV